MATTDSSETDSQPQDDEQQEGDHPTSGNRIDVHPVVNNTTNQDRENLLLFKVPASLTGNLEGATEQLVIGINKIFTSKITIDHLEFFAWNVFNGIMFAIGAYAGKHQNRTQRTLSEVKTDQGTLQEPLATLYRKLAGDPESDENGWLPNVLSPQVGPLPFGMFGPKPGVTSRVVMETENQTITHADKVDNVGLDQLIQECADEPFLYHAHIRRHTQLPRQFEYQVTARAALFDPRHRVSSEDDYIETLRHGRPIDPIDHFTDLGVTSSLSQIDDQFQISHWDHSESVPVKGSPFERFSHEQTHVTGDDEYSEIRRGGYGASDKLEQITAHTSLMAREVDLTNFVAVTTASPTGDPWSAVPYGTAYGIDALSSGQELTPDPVSIPVDETAVEESSDTTSSTPNDGEKRHQDAIEHVAVALKSEGYEVFIVKQDSQSRPDLWARRDDGEIFAVEVESTTRSKAASFFTNVIRQAVWGYKTITVMVPQTTDDGRTESLQTVGDWAVNQLAKPMKALDPQKTKLHNLGDDIVIDDWTILLPDGVEESEWWLTCENRYLLMHDGDILAEGDPSAPIEDFTFHTPRYTEKDDTYVVTDEDGTVLQRCQDEEDVAYTRASPCHRPVDLSYLDFVEALYCFDPEEKELVKHEIAADWGTIEEPTPRHEASHEDAFSTFIVDRDEEAKLWERNCFPFIKNWIDNLSPYGGPNKNVYGGYRGDYYEKKSRNAAVGKNHYYPGVSLRYQRGLVSPDLPGLESTPSFIDEWDVDPDAVLQEPLIHGLESRDQITDDSVGVKNNMKDMQ